MHSDDDGDSVLLGYDVTSMSNRIPAFRDIVMSFSRVEMSQKNARDRRKRDYTGIIHIHVSICSWHSSRAFRPLKKRAPRCFEISGPNHPMTQRQLHPCEHELDVVVVIRGVGSAETWLPITRRVNPTLSTGILLTP